MTTEPRIAFTGRGERIVVEVPRADPTPTPRLTDTQRAHIRSLIAREHRGDEPEVSALLRVIALTEHDLVRYSGEEHAGLIERRLRNLRRYLTEIEENT